MSDPLSEVAEPGPQPGPGLEPPEEPSTEKTAGGTEPRRSWHDPRRPGDWVLAAVLLGLAAVVIWDVAGMTVGSRSDVIGPKTLPLGTAAVVAFLVLVATCFPRYGVTVSLDG